MNLRRFLSIAICAAGLGLLWPAAAQATTSDVFRARLQVSGVFQDTNAVTQDPVIAAASLQAEDLINLARGRAADAPVPANEVLAMVRDRDDNDKVLVVFDRVAKTVLATVAEIDVEGRVHDPTKAILQWKLRIQPTGNETNALVNGEFIVTGTRVPGVDKLVIAGKGVGNLRVVSDGNSVKVIALQVRFAVGGNRIGRLITPD